MATAALARRYVAPAPYIPAPYGLLATADVVLPDSDPHWANGIVFQPNPCDPARGVLDNCYRDTAQVSKSPTVTGIAQFGAEPFTVYAALECAPVGNWSEFEARAVSALTNGEARAVESVFWTGVAENGTVSPHLAANAAATDPFQPSVTTQIAASPQTTGGPVDPVEALGLLEGGLGACYGGEGVIHVPSSAVAHLSGNNLLWKDGARLRTWAGHRVAVYAPNPLVGPTGSVTAGSAWFYATGAVSYRRGPIKPVGELADGMNRAENTLTQIAERTYVISWDCCLLAAQVKLGGVTAGASQA